MSVLEMILYPMLAIAVALYGTLTIYDVIKRKMAQQGKQYLNDYLDPKRAKIFAEEYKNSKDKNLRHQSRCILAYISQIEKEERKLKKENGEE